VCLAFSACYELSEWWAALIGRASAESFLGTQGDPWDAQRDMALALAVAITVQVQLSRVHDRSMVAVARASR